MSFSNERIKLQGRKVEAQRELRSTELKAGNLVTTLRDIFDPYLEIHEIDTDRGVVAAAELDQVKQKAVELRSRIQKLNADLGE